MKQITLLRRQDGSCRSNLSRPPLCDCPTLIRFSDRKDLHQSRDLFSPALCSVSQGGFKVPVLGVVRGDSFLCVRGDFFSNLPLLSLRGNVFVCFREAGLVNAGNYLSRPADPRSALLAKTTRKKEQKREKRGRQFIT